MNVIIENTFINYSEEVADTYFRLQNTILLSADKDSLKEELEKLKNKIPIDEYFVYGFGRHHFWVRQRRASDPSKFFARLMIVNF